MTAALILPPTAPSVLPTALVAALGQAWLSMACQREQCVAIKDLGSRRLVYANRAFCAFAGQSADALLSQPDADWLEPEQTAAWRVAEQAALAHDGPLVTEHRFSWDGERREFEVTRVVAAQGEQRWLATVWHDLAPQRQQAQQLRQALAQIEQQQREMEALRRDTADQALRDPITGLYRRAHFDDQVRREVDLSTREHREFAIVMMEVDAWSPAVAAGGESAQNAVLEAVGRMLRSGTRAMDASCRYGPRRFAVLLSGVGLATAHARMESIRRKCAATWVVHDGRELTYGVSVGVASFPHTAQAQDELVAACAAALDEAQRRGGNQVTLASIRFEPNA